MLERLQAARNRLLSSASAFQALGWNDAKRKSGTNAGHWPVRNPVAAGQARA